MISHPLGFDTRKSLCVQIGDQAGKEIADLLLKLATRIDELERRKVNVTPIGPSNSRVLDARQLETL